MPCFTSWTSWGRRKLWLCEFCTFFPCESLFLTSLVCHHHFVTLEKWTAFKTCWGRNGNQITQSLLELQTSEYLLWDTARTPPAHGLPWGWGTPGWWYPQLYCAPKAATRAFPLGSGQCWPRLLLLIGTQADASLGNGKKKKTSSGSIVQPYGK